MAQPVNNGASNGTTTDPANKWAILIGIDDYSERKKHTTPRTNINGNLLHIQNLQGCARDVMNVETYLIERLNVPPENIEKLAAPLDVYYDRKPESPSFGRSDNNERPTYKNIIKKLRNVARSVRECDSGLPKRKRGDHIYIHYSGHGGRARTVYSQWRAKAVGKLDQSESRGSTSMPSVHETEDHGLVPCDIQDGGRLLRDLEIAQILHDMDKEGLHVTLTFDCCHSGGTHRGAGESAGDDVRVRGISEVMRNFEADGEIENEAKDWLNKWAGNPYGLYQPRGYVLLAACQDLQKAKDDNGGTEDHD